MIQYKFNWLRLNFLPLLIVTFILLFTSCSELDERNFEDESYFTASHSAALNDRGNTQGLKASDGAILSYLRDGADLTAGFGLKAVDIGMDLRSNDMDMNSNTTHFHGYSLFDNGVLTDFENEFLWEFFYKVINRSNSIINSIADDSPQALLDYKYKSLAYRVISYFIYFDCTSIQGQPTMQMLYR